MRLRVLEVDKGAVADLSPLAGLAGLEHLSVSYGSLADLSPLAGLTGLRVLWLVGNDIADLSPLAGLTGLESLALGSNEMIRDVAPLAGLTRLEVLRLSRNRIVDVSPLAGLTGLERLGLDGNEIRDVAPLAGLTRLKSLWLSRNRIVDVSPLSGLAQVRSLNLLENDIVDIGPLAEMPNLVRLRLAWNRIEDVSVLAELDLNELDLRENLIGDASPLAGLTRLHTLHLSGNRIVDASPLAGLTEMRRLGLARTGRADVSALAGMPLLEELDLDENRIVDASPLAGLTRMRRLGLARTGLADVSALSGMPLLEELDLDGNAVADASPLAGLAALEELGLDLNRVADVSPLAGLARLRTLRLGRNGVADVSPLSGLAALEELELPMNRVGDLSPLADNAGLGSGDRLDVRGNPLSAASLAGAVAELRARGVALESGAGPRLAGVHNDNVAVMRVEEDIATAVFRTGLLPDFYAWEFYAHFEDAFDYLMFVSNLESGEHEGSRYSALYRTVRNDVRGTGEGPTYRKAYRSARLKGVTHSISRGQLLRSVSHEIMHTWANYAVPAPDHVHWGFSSANGQLGGFDLATLVDLGAGRYKALWGYPEPYSPIELYFAGLAGPEEVPDLWVAVDGRDLTDPNGVQIVYDQHGRRLFEADDVRTYTVDDIVAEVGPRLPPVGEAQRDFRAAVVLLTDDAHPATQEHLDRLSADVAWYEQRVDDGDPDNRGNFHEVTGGRATIAMGGLSDFRRDPSAARPALPASYGTAAAHAMLADGRCVTLPDPLARRSALRDDFGAERREDPGEDLRRDRLRIDRR